MTSHLRSQTNLELPEQVYPAVLLDSLRMCECVFTSENETHLFALLISRLISVSIYNHL